MSHMMNKAGWGISGALAIALLAALATNVFGGPLDPPAAPAPTQPQVEPRSPIPPANWNNTFPIAITQPGSYFLTKNLTSGLASVSGKDAIQIQADDVTLDLNGFTIDGAGGGNAAISEGASSPARKNWRISNGVIKNWPLGGVFAPDASDSFFQELRLSNDGNVSDGAIKGGGAVTVRDVTASANPGSGIVLGPLARVSDCFVDTSVSSSAVGIQLGDQSSLDGCSTVGPFRQGIYATSATTIKSCSTRGTTTTGVYVVGSGNVVSDCRTEGGDRGIQGEGTGQVILRNFVASNSGCGIIVNTGTEVADNRVLSVDTGVCIIGSGDTVMRNSFSNVTTAVVDGYSLQADVPSVVPASQATNPYANVCYSPPGVCTSKP